MCLAERTSTRQEDYSRPSVFARILNVQELPRLRTQLHIADRVSPRATTSLSWSRWDWAAAGCSSAAGPNTGTLLIGPSKLPDAAGR